MGHIETYTRCAVHVEKLYIGTAINTMRRAFVALLQGRCGVRKLTLTKQHQTRNASQVSDCYIQEATQEYARLGNYHQ